MDWLNWLSTELSGDLWVNDIEMQYCNMAEKQILTVYNNAALI